MIKIETMESGIAVEASGKHIDLLSESIAITLEMHRFVYKRLGKMEYLFFLMEMQKLSKGDNLMDFLEKDPDQLTQIQMDIPHNEEDD